MEASCLELALEGERLCKAGDFKGGTAFFEAAVQVGTEDLKTLSAIYSQLGNAYFYLKEYGKALEYHKHDLTLARWAGLNLSLLFFELSKYSLYSIVGPLYKGQKFVCLICVQTGQQSLHNLASNLDNNYLQYITVPITGVTVYANDSPDDLIRESVRLLFKWFCLF